MAKVYRIERNDKVGRYMIADKDLAGGDTVLTEYPAVIGPKVDSPVICLTCFTPLNARVLCSKCGWPVCNETCGKASLHADGECSIFAANKIKFQPPEDLAMPNPQYECITALRLLLLRDKDKAKWDEVLRMESHCEKRKLNEEFWNAEKVNIVEFVRIRCKMDSFAEDLIHKICGILEVNCFEVRSADGFMGRGLYTLTALMSHNCVANTTHSVIPPDNYKIIVRTTTEVKKNQELYSSYTFSLHPTLVRRANLSYSKYFDCDCARCADPKELGTHMSSLKCTKCDPGLVLSTNPLDGAAPWKCTDCEFQLSGNQLERINAVIEKEIESLNHIEPDRVIEESERLLRQYKSVLHPNHAFLTILKHSLVQFYGRSDGYTYEDLPDILLERKANLCKDILIVIDVVEPGKTRLRGLMLFEQHIPQMLYAQSRYRYGELTGKKLKDELENVRDVLKEAVEILKLEDPASPEGSIAVGGLESLKELEESILTVQV
ncbi:hypothetical protein M8J77_007961 [Diaphorina citri]|nr:hypothetical protein M8J77_007961 [Diaphorina citri]